MTPTTNANDTPVGEEQLRVLALRVRRRKRVAVALLLLLIPVATAALGFGGPSLGIVAALSAFFVVGVTCSIWLLTMQCPRCRHPLFWDEKWGFNNLRWLTLNRCGHCGLGWSGQDTAPRQAGEANHANVRRP